MPARPRGWTNEGKKSNACVRPRSRRAGLLGVDEGRGGAVSCRQSACGRGLTAQWRLSRSRRPAPLKLRLPAPGACRGLGRERANHRRSEGTGRGYELSVPGERARADGGDARQPGTRLSACCPRSWPRVAPGECAIGGGDQQLPGPSGGPRGRHACPHAAPWAAARTPGRGFSCGLLGSAGRRGTPRFCPFGRSCCLLIDKTIVCLFSRI